MTAKKRGVYAIRRQVLAWHRRVGLMVSAVVLFVVATGLFLNHVESLGLDRKVVENEAVLDWYDMEPEDDLVGFKVGANWLTSLEGSLYLNDRHLAETATDIKGALAVNDLVIVAGAKRLLVFTNDGSLVEKLSGAGMPGPIEAIGHLKDNHVMLRTPAGRFSTTVDFIDWTKSAAAVDWVQPADLPSNIEAAIKKSYNGGGLPWSRLLLDIHTGRILGAWGPYLIDIAALALLVLIGTGIYNWLGHLR